MPTLLSKFGRTTHQRPTLIHSAVAILALAGALAMSNRPAEAQQADFGAQVSVHQLNLDVVTQDAKGKPIFGLNKADFQVQEDGKPVDIVDFRAPSPETRTLRVATTPKAGASETSTQMIAVPESQYIVLGFDFQTVDLQTLARAIPEIRDFVKSNAGPGVHWALVILRPEPYAVTDFSEKPADVEEGLQTLLKLRRGTAARIWGWGSFQTASFSQEASTTPAQFDSSGSGQLSAPPDEGGRAVTTPGQTGGAPNRITSGADFAAHLEACSAWNGASAADAATDTEELVRSLSTADGRKNLVIFYAPEETPAGGLSADCVQVAQEVRGFWQQASDAASAAGFTVYSSDIGGLDARSLQRFRPDQRGLAIAENTDVNQNPRDFGGLSTFRMEDAVKMLAVRTGGRDIRSNQLREVLQWVNTDNEQRYRLTLNIPHPHDGKVHTLDVSLKGHPLAQLHYRRAYEDLSTRQKLDRQLSASGNLPKTGGSFPCELKVETTSSSQLGHSIQGTVSVPADRLGFVLQPDGSRKAEVTAVFAVYDVTGKRVHITRVPHELNVPAGAENQIAGQTFRQDFRVRLPLGDFTVAGAIYNAIDDTACIRSAQVGNPEGNPMTLSQKGQADASSASSVPASTAGAASTSTANSHQSAPGSNGSPS